ncbi:Phospholipase A2-beta [Sesamum angolense]|uniref:Phospholipase A2-beta n=1 Tax=Sesamum angolense TaxID=2727404 RepID=A0AAE1WP19_9LAMI|nr:Phospholipase A2-beta [Sesamum angolense]
MLPRSAVSAGQEASAAFLFFFIVIAESANDSQVGCSKTCVAENCDTIGIRYGKYCGVGWSGCPGEKPCDDLDACCKIHDECVENNESPFNLRGT